MKIVPMERAQVRRLAEIERACFADPWSEQGLLEELENPCASFRVAVEDSGAVAGYIGCHIVLDEGYIANVAVAPEWRRRGIGRLLVENLLEEARLRRLAFVTLEVRASNAAARELYRQCGFHDVGERPRFYENPTENAVLMTREFDKEGTNV